MQRARIVCSVMAVAAAVSAAVAGCNKAPDVQHNGKPLGEWISQAGNSGDTNVRRAAINQLGTVKGEGAVAAAEALVDLLDDRDGTVRILSLQQLIAIGAPAKPALQAAARSSSERVMIAASVALAHLQKSDASLVPVLFKTSTMHYENARGLNLKHIETFAEEALGQMEGPAVDAVIKGFGEPNANVRLLAARAVFAMGPKKAAAALPGLEKLMNDEYEVLRDMVASNIHNFRPDGRKEEPRKPKGKKAGT